MSIQEKEIFLKVALAMKAIDLKQFNEARKSLGKDPSKDGGKVLLDKGFISESEYREIDSLISEAASDLKDKVKLPDGEITPVEEGEIYEEDFTLKKIIGQGGAGRVFLAFDKNIGRDVAIKEVLPAKLDSGRDYHLSRFIREAKISGRLQHPGIVPVYELKQKDDGTYFYVMKFVQGRTLFHAIVECCSGEGPEDAFRRRLSLLDRLIGASEAMGYAHSKGFIHRDLKPSNVVLGEFGETIILDWGLAKRIGEADAQHTDTDSIPDKDDTADGLTREGAQLGTPSYMAPEQIDPAFGTVDARTDVYTLGVILFMILTGSKPYPGRGAEVMERIRDSEQTPSPRDLYEFIPPELSAICEKAMAKKQDDRFANASELAEELKAYRDGRLVSVYAYSTGELLKRFISRNKAAVIASALLIVSIFVGAGITTNYAVEAHVAKKKALNALNEVTNLAESAMILVRSKAQSVNEYFTVLEKDMLATSKRISTIGFGNKAAMSNNLEAISKKHPEAESFLLIDMKGNVIDSYPNAVFIPKPIIERELRYLKGEKVDTDGDLGGLFDAPGGNKAFLMSVPVIVGKKIMAGLTTLMEVETAIPKFLDFDPKTSPYQVWLMKDDGLIVYDEDPKQVGLNLFTDEIYKSYPELLRFGEMIRTKPWGIGHYSFLGTDKKTNFYKVAAWDTLSSDGTNWKLVVTHEYASK